MHDSCTPPFIGIGLNDKRSPVSSTRSQGQELRPCVDRLSLLHQNLLDSPLYGRGDGHFHLHGLCDEKLLPLFHGMFRLYQNPGDFASHWGGYHFLTRNRGSSLFDGRRKPFSRSKDLRRVASSSHEDLIKTPLIHQIHFVGMAVGDHGVKIL